MKVFVVTCGVGYILGVYSTKEKANQAIEHDQEESKWSAKWYDINEWEIDKFKT